MLQESIGMEFSDTVKVLNFVHAQGASCYLTSLSPVQAAEQGIRHPNGRSLDQVKFILIRALRSCVKIRGLHSVSAEWKIGE